MTAAHKPRVPHTVWVTFTVQVQREGDNYPLKKHGRTERVTVHGQSHEQAFRRGERELARLMAERFQVRGTA